MAILSLFIGVAASAAPANPNATTKAKQVLAYLQGLPAGSSLRVLSGQNVGHGSATVSGYSKWVTGLQAKTGRWVALLGVDYGLTVDPAGISAANGVVKQHWAAGGLVEVSIHFTNPFTGGDAWNRSGVDLTQLVTPGSAAYSTWMGYLDKVAAGLAELRDAGVVVLWRPFHEMNGDWFWWSSKGSGFASPAEFTQLWKSVFDYFTNVKGLDNLLWVYAPNAQLNAGAEKTTTYYYPGASMVDVVGEDIYLDNLSSGVDANGSMTALLGLGKPFGLTEWGPKSILDGSFDDTVVIKGIKSAAPQAAFFLQWHSWSGASVAIVDCQNATALMTDPWIISRDQIGLAAPPPPPAPDAAPPPPVKKDAGAPPPAPDAAPPPPAKKDAGAPPPAPAKEAGAPKPGAEAGVARKDSGVPPAARIDGGSAAGGEPDVSGSPEGRIGTQASPQTSGQRPDDGPKCNLDASASGSSPGAAGLLLFALFALALLRRRRG